MSANSFSVVKSVPMECMSHMVPGTIIYLHFTRPTVKRFSATLIGYDANHFLVVKLNDSSQWHQFGRHFYAENACVARVLIESEWGECLAFRTSIVKASTHPCSLLYLDFPDVIERAELRRHKRVPTCIAATITDGNTRELRGELRDVSLSGCCFYFSMPEGKVGIEKTSVTVSAGRYMIMRSEIRNQRHLGKHSWAVGVEFKAPPDKNQKLLSTLHIPASALAS